MSDMNLPTVEIDPRTADFIGRHDTGRINLAFDMEDWSPNPGTYALVPVDAMEKDWWCELHGSSALRHGDGSLAAFDGVLMCEVGNAGDGYCEVEERWLLSAKEEGR